jgi:Tol biopolymer transport system component/DNA-binding winged helix-turn-helix (wHTH) protein
MAMPGTQGEIYRFGVFELFSATGELRKHGLRLKLQDQPVRILILLLEHAGEIVTREQIQKRLWADDVHVDYENAINSAVRKIREALTDTSDNPRFVETVARRGYRFIAPVGRVRTGAVVPEVVTEVMPEVMPVELHAPRVRLKSSWPLPASALVAVVAIAAAVWLWQGKAGSQAALKTVPLTSYPGYEQAPTFSPDGNQVAFSWNGENGDNYDIYVKLVGPGRPLRLTTNPAGDGFPAWSPDGRSIAFRRLESDGSGTILLIPALGGAEREVTRLGKTSFSSIGGWFPDGRRLLISWKDKEGEPYGLFWVSLDTGEKQRITSPPSGTSGDLWCAISPDGQTVAFSRARGSGAISAAGSVGDLYTLPLTSDLAPKEGPKRLTFDNAGIGQMAWTADSREIVFSSSRGGSPALWRMPVAGSQKPKRLEVGDNAYFPAISPRSNRLVYQQAIPADNNIWRIDLKQPAAPPVSLIASTRQDMSAHYSPDGKRIVFHSDRSGSDEIWVCDADGSNAAQLTTKGHSGSPHWSPDGARIAFDSMVDGTWQIFEMSSQGGPPRQLTSGSAMRPSWSRDGKWVYFGTSRTGRYEVWKVAADGGTAVQLSRNGGNNPVESEDGTAIYYNSGHSIMRAATDGSGETTVTDGVRDNVTNMAVTRDGIYYRDMQPPLGAVRFFSFASGKSRLILKTERPSMEVSISPDGHWLLYMQQDGQPGSDLMLVENFH